MRSSVDNASIFLLFAQVETGLPRSEDNCLRLSFLRCLQSPRVHQFVSPLTPKRGTGYGGYSTSDQLADERSG
jgi:hypothetical protein